MDVGKVLSGLRPTLTACMARAPAKSGFFLDAANCAVGELGDAVPLGTKAREFPW